MVSRYIMGIRVSALQNKTVLEISCTTMCIDLALLNCMLRSGCDNKFYATCFL